jgi:L-asparaginase
MEIVLLTTGGTIAMQQQAAAGGAVPALVGVDFLKALPSGLPPLRAEEYANLPSAHLTLELLWGLRQRIAEIARDPGTRGIVVSQGTDTLEESAYLMDLTVPGETPIVFTAAMRTASDVGYEGLANLASAIRTCASPAARGLGVLVVLNDEVHAARFVTKTHTLALNTFQSPGHGRLGRVDLDGVWIESRLAREIIDCERLQPAVALIKLGVGMDASAFEDAVIRGARGVVIEALGGGRLPPWWLPPIEAAISQGVAVVIASRCPAGRVTDRYGYAGAHRDQAALGCGFAGGLNGQKARIRLMAALGLAGDAPGALRWFER